MNRGLLIKCLRETWPLTLGFAVALFTFEAVLAAILPSFLDDAGQFLQIPFLRNMMRALLGAEFGDSLGPIAINAIAWSHPMILTMLWAHAIVFCTRMPAAEIDRGTIDVLLAFPVSRGEAYRTETVVWLVSGVILVGMAACGNMLVSASATSDTRLGAGRVLVIVANLFCLYVAVGGLAYLVSASSERRGRAVGAVFALVMLSFFVHVLGQFWPPAQSFAFAGLLHYYRPFAMLQTDAWPWGDLAILLGLGAAFWAIGGVIFARRNICTV